MVVVEEEGERSIFSSLLMNYYVVFFFIYALRHFMPRRRRWRSEWPYHNILMVHIIMEAEGKCCSVSLQSLRPDNLSLLNFTNGVSSFHFGSGRGRNARAHSSSSS